MQQRRGFDLADIGLQVLERAKADVGGF